MKSFVVMFENQFASREHDSRVPCPTRGIADAGGMAIRLSAGVAQRMRRVGEYVHGRRTASRRGAVGGTRVARGRIRLGHPVGELPLEIPMRGDGITSASRRLRLGACTASSRRTLGFAGLVSIAIEHLGEILAGKINRHVRHIVRQRAKCLPQAFLYSCA